MVIGCFIKNSWNNFSKPNKLKTNRKLLRKLCVLNLSKEKNYGELCGHKQNHFVSLTTPFREICTFHDIKQFHGASTANYMHNFEVSQIYVSLVLICLLLSPTNLCVDSIKDLLKTKS